MSIFAISPHSTSGEVVADLATLGYLLEPVLDPTFGPEGGMWTHYWPQDLTVNHDEYDFRHLPQGWAGRFGSVLFDPPYRLSGTATNVGGFDDRYGTNRSYRRLEDVRCDILTGLSECARVTRIGGYVIVKCQDQISSGKYQWQVGWIVNRALARGMMLVDQIHLQSYRAQPSGRRQVHARRNYSTFLVLRKEFSMGHVYIHPPLYGFKLLMDEGALRNGKRSLRPEVVPTRLVTDYVSQAKILRDLGDNKWAGTKGAEDFHKDFLSILNYPLAKHEQGVTLYYEGGHRGTATRTRPRIMDFPLMPDDAGERLDFLDNFVQVLQYHYGPAESFSPDQARSILNWVATMVTEDPEMVDLIQLA